MIHLGVLYPDSDDSCSFYRGAGPITQLRRIMPELTIQPIMTNGWSDIRRHDIVFIQRPHTDIQLKVMQAARQCNVPIWIDWDDDFTCIPRDNPNWGEFTTKEMQNQIHECMRIATVVTTTTQALADTLRKYNSNVLVIPNAHDDYLLGPCDPTEPRSPTILWRGSNTHQNDLMHYKEEIIEVAKKNPDFEWYFLGYYPFFLTTDMKHKFHPATTVNKYFAMLRHIRPAIMMVPLVDNQFNRAKSSIAHLEATWAGAMTVFPGYWSGGGFIYHDKKSFGDGLQHAIDALDGGVTGITKKAAALIQDSRSLSGVNHLRAALLRDLYRVALTCVPSMQLSPEQESAYLEKTSSPSSHANHGLECTHPAATLP